MGNGDFHCKLKEPQPELLLLNYDDTKYNSSNTGSNKELSSSLLFG